MGILNVSQTELLKEIDKTLRTVISQFYYYPHLFFNENGLRDYFFAVFYRNKFFSTSNLITTEDGKKINLVHPEYGSWERVPDKWRAWYDMVILNPKFIKNNEYLRVVNKSISLNKRFSYKNDDLLAVFELKLIQIKSNIYKKQLKKDYNSLKNAKEALIRYMVVFSSIKDDEDFFNDIEWNNNFRLVYIKVYFDNKNKKHVEVLIKPNNFLDLPESWLIKDV